MIITGINFLATSSYLSQVLLAGNLSLFLSDLLSGNDTIIGSNLGSPSGDKLLGFNGDDTIIGGAGPDSLVGGAGINTASYVTAPAGVVANIGTPGYNTGDAAGDSYSGIQNLTGSQFADFLYGDGSVNVLSGLAGDDKLVGIGGADRLDGGAGRDTAGYDASSAAGVRADLLTTWTNTNEAAGDTYVSIENLAGSSFNDLLLGDNANNVISGILYPRSPSGADQMWGRGGNDTLLGYDNNDRLDGGLGNDGLYGGEGADTLIGGPGIDNLFGGQGADSFVFRAPLNARTNRDVVRDFSRADDTILLEHHICCIAASSIWVRKCTITILLGLWVA
jgi:Ca2+-binding RTX toxin-like protein